MSTVIDNIEAAQLRNDHPSFAPGDRVRVHFQVIEGNRRRIQVFEGVVIRRQGSGLRETFTVRKQSFGVGVERTFPLHSPKIEQLEVAARGDVRRAKLYYLRGRIGKAARVAERRWGSDDDLNAKAQSAAAVAEEVAETPVESAAEAEAVAEAPPEAPENEAAAEATKAEEPAAAEETAEAEQAADAEAPAEEAEAEDPAEQEAEAEAGAEAPEAESAGEAEAESGEEDGVAEAGDDSSESKA